MGKKRIRFNLNDVAIVKLTEHGKKLNREYVTNMNASYPYLQVGNKDASEVKDQFWRILERFARHQWISRLTPPYDCNIEILTETEQPE